MQLSPSWSLFGWLPTLTALVLVSALVGCGGPSVQIDGSSTVYPITQAVAVGFSKERPDIRVPLGQHGTGVGMAKLVKGEIDIADASRQIKEGEVKKLKEQGAEALEFIVAYDGITVAVHPENDWVDCLTVEQLRRLWEPNSKVETWKDLNEDWPAEKIQLYGPGTASGTFEYFTEAVMGEAGASRTDFSPSENDNFLVRGIASSKYALGYFGYAYYAGNQGQLRAVPIAADMDGNCVEPSLDTIRTGAYAPLSRPLFLYVRASSLARPEVADFLRFYFENDEKFVTEAQYVPARDEVMEENLRRLNAAIEKAQSK